MAIDEATRERERRAAREALQAWAAREGREPTYNAWIVTPEGMPARTKLAALWGSWRGAMIGCGFTGRGPGEYEREYLDRTVECANPACSEPIGEIGYNDRCANCARYLLTHDHERDLERERAELAQEKREAVVAFVCALAKRLGRTPTMHETRDAPGCPCSVATFYRLFGSWYGVLDACGLEPDLTWRSRPRTRRLAA